jgi:hypothetical protein
VRLENESILLAVRSRVALDIAVPRELQVSEPFSLKCDSGTAYVTNVRVGSDHEHLPTDSPLTLEQVIYLPAKPTEQFKSFFAPIERFEDTDVGSSGLFGLGAWFWFGTVVPIRGGGIPVSIPRIEVKLTFKEGGHSEFKAKFDLIRERLLHARELERETGQRIIVHDEPLPPYQALGPVSPSQSQAGRSQAADTSLQAPESREQSSQPVPDEPPPGYAEAHAQAVRLRFQERSEEELDK